jgi:hypothetical protein
VWLSTARCARELVFTLFVLWRADPGAVSVTTPWLALRAALLAGTPMRTGPFALAGMLSGGPGSPSTPPCSLCIAMGASANAIRGLLFQGLSGIRLARLAARRPGFAYLEHGFDRRSTSGFEATSAPESRKAALRVEQFGGAITQTVASRWIRGGPQCPFCRWDSEDPFHRFWRCPRWYKLPSASMGTHTRRALEVILGKPCLTTGSSLPTPTLRPPSRPLRRQVLAPRLIPSTLKCGQMAAARSAGTCSSAGLHGRWSGAALWLTRPLGRPW